MSAIFAKLAGLLGLRRPRELEGPRTSAPPAEDRTAVSPSGIGSTGGISGGSEGNSVRPAGGDIFSLGAGAISASPSAGFSGTADSGCGDIGGGDSGGGDCGGSS